MSASVSRELPVADKRVVHNEPRAAYIHVPFCRHRCGYCNFTLVAGRDDLIGDYLQAIDLELSTLQSPREVDTLYFGGGTPTHLSSVQFRELAETVLKWHPLAEPSLATASPERPSPSLQGRGNASEWTVEANPADINSAMVETLAKLGVTRLSLGSQSFRAEKLRLLERDHEAVDIERAVSLAKGAGMQVSVDLIFATPSETLDEWSDDLAAAISLRPDHVSTYGLTFEQGTSYWSRRQRSELQPVDEELEREMYAMTIDRLVEAGFEHYEVSNFSQPGCRSRHNQVYWSGDGYFAAGPGAARYINGIRESNHRSVTTYLKSLLAGESPVAEREELSAESRARELLVFGLRRLDGVARAAFRQRTGFEVDELVAVPLRKFVDLALLGDDGARIQLTREGLFVSDAIWPEFL